MNFQQRLLHHWQAKLGSFLAACVLWIVLKEAFEPGTLDQILTGTRVKPTQNQDRSLLQK